MASSTSSNQKTRSIGKFFAQNNAILHKISDNSDYVSLHGVIRRRSPGATQPWWFKTFFRPLVARRLLSCNCMDGLNDVKRNMTRSRIRNAAGGFEDLLDGFIFNF